MSNQLKSIFNSFMKSKGWYDDVIAIQIMPALEKILKKDVSDLLIIRSVDNGNLVIQVLSSVWKFELIQRKNQIMEELNLEIQDYKIKNIHFM